MLIMVRCKGIKYLILNEERRDQCAPLVISELPPGQFFTDLSLKPRIASVRGFFAKYVGCVTLYEC